MQMKRLIARLACYQEAVSAARLAGETWMEIGNRLGIPGEAARRAYARAQAAVRAGHLVPREQLPLPDPSARATQAVPAPTPGDTKKPVPGKHPSGRHLLPGEKLRDDGLEF